jgi:hypothetical protein
MQVKVVGVQYTSPNTYGDFKWMIKQPEYSDALFIFNDNEEHHETDKQGLGNAVIRPWNKYGSAEIPRSAGIPTGTLKKGGYNMLTNSVQNVIDDAIIEIKELIQNYNYSTIYYSVGSNGKLGTSLFYVNQNVINYIDEQINNFIL